MTNRRVLALASLLSLYCATAYTDDDASAFEFRSIGPAVMGGRIDTVALVEDEPSIIYIGTASGGLWKSTNMGTTWTSLFHGHHTSSIGDVALSRSDPDAVWVGTGEPNNRQSSSFGNGVYKSVDGGESFEHVGLEATARHAPLYGQWIEMYASEEFKALADWLRDRADTLAQSQNPQGIQKMEDAYLASLRYEYLFWESCYNLEVWPI